MFIRTYRKCVFGRKPERPRLNGCGTGRIRFIYVFIFFAAQTPFFLPYFKMDRQRFKVIMATSNDFPWSDIRHELFQLFDWQNRCLQWFQKIQGFFLHFNQTVLSPLQYSIINPRRSPRSDNCTR